jgi:hypothetical protein
VFRIPEEVFEHQVLPFLKLDETSVLLSSANSFFEQFRYRSGKRNFKVSLRDFADPKIQKLLQKINPVEQLIVSCYYCLQETTRCHDIAKAFTNNDQLVLPRRLCTCPCYGLSPPVDPPKIQELYLSNCFQLTDVDCLSHLTWLFLNHCPDLHDIYSLGNIPSLSIIDCQGIRDISALQNNKALSIHQCRNISLSNVNFEHILYLSTDLHLTYDATATLKHAITLELFSFHQSGIFLSSTVVSVGIRNQVNYPLPLEVNLSNFSQSIKSVLLKNVSSSVDLMPLGNIEKVQLSFLLT